MLTDTRRTQLIDICQSLVQFESLSGNEQPIIERIAAWMRQLGYADIRVDECGNLIGALYGGDGPTVLYDSHVDIVPAADADRWTYPPFDARVVDDRIYGRGTSDMKGALAASLLGLAAAHEDGVLKGTALVSASVGEEIIEGLAMGYVVDHYQPDLVIICESTALKLGVAQRGRAEINIAVQGKSAHASSPQIGINAFRNMSRLVLELDKLPPPTDPQLGAGILEPTTVISSPYPNVSVIPWRCDARYDRRTLVGETAEDVLAPIHEVIARLHGEDPKFNAEAVIVDGEFTCYTGLKLKQETFAPAWRMAKEGDWVRAARAALGEVELSHYNFCTNGSYSLGRKGIPTLGYGPGYEHAAHTTDEYLELDQLFGAAEGYYKLAGLTV
jgi:putative selenium metabolism hydrolase